MAKKNKIIKGLNEALAYAKGDKSKGRLTRVKVKKKFNRSKAMKEAWARRKAEKANLIEKARQISIKRADEMMREPSMFEAPAAPPPFTLNDAINEFARANERLVALHDAVEDMGAKLMGTPIAFPINTMDANNVNFNSRIETLRLMQSLIHDKIDGIAARVQTLLTVI